MKGPIVSVIIPVLDGQAFIREAIESFIAQDYERKELIVVDDGSTDGTAAIAATYVLRGEPVVYLKQEHAGAAAALNNGIREALGGLICWLSHDDIFLPGKITAQVEAMEDESVSGCYTDFEIIGAEGTVLETIKVKPPEDRDMFAQVMLQNIVNGSSMMLRRWAFDLTGPFDEDLAVDVDGDYWLRMLAQGQILRHVPEVLLKYRRHAGQLSANRETMWVTKDQVRAKNIQRAAASAMFPDRRLDEIGPLLMNLSGCLNTRRLTRAAMAARDKAGQVAQQA